MIVQGTLSRRAYLSLAAALAALAVGAIGGLAWWHGSWLPPLVAVVAGLLAAGYSLPPIKLANRALGEATVGFLFGLAVVEVDR